MLNKVAEKERQERAAPAEKSAVTLTEHTVEVISDSGEGAQKCGQSFGSIAAKMGNEIGRAHV